MVPKRWSIYITSCSGLYTGDKKFDCHMSCFYRSTLFYTIVARVKGKISSWSTLIGAIHNLGIMKSYMSYMKAYRLQSRDGKRQNIEKSSRHNFKMVKLTFNSFLSFKKLKIYFSNVFLPKIWNQLWFISFNGNYQFFPYWAHIFHQFRLSGWLSNKLPYPQMLTKRI